MYLKKRIPNLKVVVMYDKTHKISELCKQLIDMLDIFDEVMEHSIEEYHTVEIPNLVFLRYGNNQWLMRDVTLSKSGSRKPSEPLYHNMVSKIIKRQFLKFQAPLYDSKIYLQLEPSKYLRDGRKYTKEDVEKLENFFKDNGYEIFNPVSASLKEQIKKISSARVVASLSGSNSAHSLWMKDEATFILMNLGSSYFFPHDDLIKNNCRIEFLKGPVEETISYIKKALPHLL